MQLLLFQVYGANYVKLLPTFIRIKPQIARAIRLYQKSSHSYSALRLEVVGRPYGKLIGFTSLHSMTRCVTFGFAFVIEGGAVRPGDDPPPSESVS